MTGIQLPILLIAAAVALILCLQIIFLLRKTSVELPPELLVRLDAVEQSSRATLQATAKNEGVLDGLAQQIRGFSQATSSSLESVRHAIDEKLAQTVAESRQGRTELLTSFQGFEGKLEQRLSRMDVSMGTRFESLQTSTSASLETSRQAVDEKLAQTVAESRQGRTELLTSFQGFEGKLENRLTGFDASLTQRFDALQLAVSSRLEETSNGLLAHLTQAQTDATTMRKELHDALTGFRSELTLAMGALAAESGKSREAMNDNAKLFEIRIQERFEVLTGTTRQTLDSLKADINSQLAGC